MWEELELNYGPVSRLEGVLLHHLTHLGRLQLGLEFYDSSEHDEAIGNIYQKVWDDLVRLRPSLIERFIEVEGIVI